jgi:F-type H+-transporting ATPase subunit epsilon
VSTAATEQKRLGVQILTPEGSVLDGVAAMIVALQAGSTRVKMLDESEVVMATTDGYMSVEDDRVLIMVEQAELAGDIDRARAEVAVSTAEAAIAAAGDDQVALDAAQAALRRAQNRLKVVDKAAS